MVNSLIIGSKEGHQVCLTSRECAGLCCTLLTSAGSIFSHSSSSGWWYLSLCSASNFSKKNIWLHKKCLSSFKRPHLLHFTSIFCASFAVMSPCSSASSLVNNFRIRSSNSQQLEQVHRSSLSQEKRGIAEKKKVLQLSQPHLWCSWWANSAHKSNHFLSSSSCSRGHWRETEGLKAQLPSFLLTEMLLLELKRRLFFFPQANSTKLRLLPCVYFHAVQISCRVWLTDPRKAFERSALAVFGKANKRNFSKN